MAPLRPSRPPVRGPQVRRLQRRLDELGYDPGTVDGIFGPATARCVRRFQREHGLAADGVVGPATRTALAAARTPRLPTPRAAVIEMARWGIANEPEIHYSEDAAVRLAALDTPCALPLATDCSGFVTLCYRWAGAPDPNGRDFDGRGYTGTMLEACAHVARAAVQPGDLVVWGPPPGHHVALVLEPGADPLLCSHGQERGPEAVAFSVESAYQPAPATWLACPGLV